MVKQRAGYQKHLKELSKFSKKEENPLLFDLQEKLIHELSQPIKAIENEMHQLIEEDASIKENYQLATSVKGIGLIVGVSLLVYTNNFTKFKTWRQFASYAGTAPFSYESGSSIKGGKRVNNMANKTIKALLSNAAASNIQYDPEMRLYYEKRIKEGKNKMLVQNIIKNKVLARVFAVIKRGTSYVNILSYAA
jgi:transposase